MADSARIQVLYRLPQAGGVPATARIYLRPVGLSTERSRRATWAEGASRRLAGGALSFTACEVLLREAESVHCAVVTLDEIETWVPQLESQQQRRALQLLERLSASRDLPGVARHGWPLLMGIVNASPDSFSDAGAFNDVAALVSHARQLAAEGAAILDVGGESTRPGAEPVPLDEELRRVAPVLDALGRESGGALLSIDTRKAAVMRAALAAGAGMINDVSALADDPESLAVAAGSDAWIVLMHKRGEPATMNLAPHYDHAALDVFDELEARIAACEAAGITRARLIVDPGIAFAKRGADNLEILRSLALYHGLGCPILLGVSRKGLTHDLDRRYAPKERLPGSIAVALWARDQGVQVLRVHDVAATRQALEVWRLLAQGGD